MRSSSFILTLALPALLLAACSRGARVIPEKTFVSIYEEMLIADQWMNDNYAERRKVDTSLYYEPIFRKYGFTTEDYLKSVGHYMEKPDEYIRIIEKVKDRLKEKERYYNDLQAVEAGIDASGEEEAKED
ncbi:MAG: DUF4296 domain-containing protein [Bacteroidales bacterium]|nr:DUF4296 domain-containing protein [Bacteroidales bacterium]